MEPTTNSQRLAGQQDGVVRQYGELLGLKRGGGGVLLHFNVTATGRPWWTGERLFIDECEREPELDERFRYGGKVFRVLRAMPGFTGAGSPKIDVFVEEAV